MSHYSLTIEIMICVHLPKRDAVRCWCSVTISVLNDHCGMLLCAFEVLISARLDLLAHDWIPT